MTQERMTFTTPVGRFVSGSLTEKRTKDISGRPIEPDKQRYEFGVAIAKNDPGLMPVIQAIVGHAKAGYSAQPHITQRIDTWFQTMQGFSMKIADGDKPNARGQVNQNTTGHFVFWFSTAIEIKTCGPDNIQIDPSQITRGWYVDVYGSCAVNGLQDNNAGIYLNPEWVRLIAEGDAIVGGIGADEAFGAPAPAGALPPGARPVGSAPQPAPGTGMPGGGMPGGGMPGAAQQPAPGTGMPGGGMPGAAPGMPDPTQPAPVPAATAPVGMPGMAPTQPAAQPQTASPGEQHPAHPGILGAGLPG